MIYILKSSRAGFEYYWRSWCRSWGGRSNLWRCWTNWRERPNKFQRYIFIRDNFVHTKAKLFWDATFWIFLSIFLGCLRSCCPMVATAIQDLRKVKVAEVRKVSSSKLAGNINFSSFSNSSDSFTNSVKYYEYLNFSTKMNVTYINST